MRRLLPLTLVLVLFLCSLTACNNVATAEAFDAFAVECSAEDYYDLCYDYSEHGENSYFYNLDNAILFKTYTMVLMSNYDTENYNLIKNQIREDLELTTISNECLIHGKTYEVYYVENENRTYGYGEFDEFGFIAMNDKEMCIDYYWFSDQDYDGRVCDEEDFYSFYNYAYSWLDAEIEK